MLTDWYVIHTYAWPARRLQITHTVRDVNCPVGCKFVPLAPVHRPPHPWFIMKVEIFRKLTIMAIFNCNGDTFGDGTIHPRIMLSGGCGSAAASTECQSCRLAGVSAANLNTLTGESGSRRMTAYAAATSFGKAAALILSIMRHGMLASTLVVILLPNVDWGRLGSLLWQKDLSLKLQHLT